MMSVVARKKFHFMNARHDSLSFIISQMRREILLSPLIFNLTVFTWLSPQRSGHAHYSFGFIIYKPMNV
ncbi:hypothetical protein Scep_013894 [Stephania cephalantha]|uniref:Uncharacterized protein n=1 Tax=Stephania cephalantha TaxID=152367 RepID=A0AAP0NZU6_9MAGN